MAKDNRVSVKKTKRKLPSGKVITIKAHTRGKPSCSHCGRYMDRCKCP